MEWAQFPSLGIIYVAHVIVRRQNRRPSLYEYAIINVPLKCERQWEIYERTNSQRGGIKEEDLAACTNENPTLDTNKLFLTITFYFSKKHRWRNVHFLE